MATGILSALRQQDGSLSELAKLPQNLIMQMAQRKEISEDMVAPILAKKAEMADAFARNKALQTAGAPRTTIMEQLMQKTAEQEQPEPQAREMGIAQLPVKEGMYSEQGMAAGGIVAFANNQDQPVSEDMPREGESESDYMKRVRAVQEAGSQLFTARNYNPIAKLQDLYNIYDRNIGQPFAQSVNRFINETPEEQAARFRSYSQKPKTEAAKIVTEQNKAIATKQAEIQDMEASSAKEPTKKPKVLVADNKSPTGMKAVPDAPQMAEPKQDAIDAMIAGFAKDIKGDPEAAKQARKEAQNMRLMEAGLNIMGGTSPYAFANIGQGAAAAAKGYGEDIKGLRAEETAKLNQLAALGLKGVALKQEARKLGITEKHYDNWLKVQTQQNNIMAGTRSDANKLRADTALESRIATLAGKLISQPKYMDNPELAYADAQKMVTGQSAQPTFAGFSGRPIK